jgi:flagellar hook-basal body complex protein FliE
VIPAISSAVHALGAQAAISPIADPTAAAATGTTTKADPVSFGDALTNAIGSLDKTQTTANKASVALADGTATNDTQAVTAVENASLAMDLASQIQGKLVTDVSTIFNTQM